MSNSSFKKRPKRNGSTGHPAATNCAAPRCLCTTKTFPNCWSNSVQTWKLWRDAPRVRRELSLPPAGRTRDRPKTPSTHPDHFRLFSLSMLLQKPTTDDFIFFLLKPQILKQLKKYIGEFVLSNLKVFGGSKINMDVFMTNENNLNQPLYVI